MFKWTDYNIARFKRLWAEGLSINVIAESLGCTRNAVTGKRARLGLPERGSPIKKGGDGPYVGQKRRRRERKAAKEREGYHGQGGWKHQARATLPPLISIVQEVPMAPKPIVRAVPQPVHGVKFKLPVKPCCWPMWGNEKSTGEFCGEDSKPGKWYCAAHHAVAYRRDGINPQQAGFLAPLYGINKTLKPEAVAELMGQHDADPLAGGVRIG